MDGGQPLIIPLLFDDTNYAYWKVHMRVLFGIFVKIFGMGFVNLILHAYALHSMFIITMFHAFQDCVTDFIL